MSGRKIDDHAFWAGSSEKGGVFPREAKMKQERSAEGAGEVSEYPDTTEAIRGHQSSDVSKSRAHKQKAGFRY